MDEGKQKMYASDEGVVSEQVQEIHHVGIVKLTSKAIIRKRRVILGLVRVARLYVDSLNLTTT